MSVCMQPTHVSSFFSNLFKISLNAFLILILLHSQQKDTVNILKSSY